MPNSYALQRYAQNLKAKGYGRRSLSVDTRCFEDIVCFFRHSFATHLLEHGTDLRYMAGINELGEITWAKKRSSNDKNLTI